jgi:hypothetical protein
VKSPCFDVPECDACVPLRHDFGTRKSIPLRSGDGQTPVLPLQGMD